MSNNTAASRRNSLYDQANKAFLDLIQNEQLGGQDKLNHILRLAAKYRAFLIQNTVIQQDGLIVQSGPFKGMKLLPEVAEGCFVPKILGCYEQELHPVIEQIMQSDYKHIVNIGSAEGYYAVGLARLLQKGTKLYAYDLNPVARTKCAEMAALNGVEDKIQIREEFKPDDFAVYKDEKTCVICDIEGDELNLLNPSVSPALAHIDLLVEMHDCFNASISSTLIERFTPTHDIEVIYFNTRDISQYPVLKSFAHLDQLLSFWEWRTGPTPWAFMTAKKDI